MSFLTHFCTICGREKIKPQGWILIALNRWADKLRILEWNDRLVELNGVHAVCSAEHARELVVHWMAMGTLDFPVHHNRMVRKFVGPADTCLGWARALGELYLHRESIQEILEENPQSLAMIADELVAPMYTRTEVCGRVETYGTHARELPLAGD